MAKTFSTLLSVLFALVMIFATSAISSATSTYWSLDVSTPATTQQSSTFNLDYYLAYTDPTDQFTVQLIANGSNVIQTQNAGNNGKFGDSGRFTIKDIPNGTYTYKVKAFLTAEPSNEKTTATRTVTIAVPSATVVVVNSSRSTDSTTSSANATDSGVSSASSTADNITSQSDDAIATTTSSDVITETSSETAGTSVEGEKDSNSTGRNVTIVLLAIALIGGLAWFVFSRLNKAEKDA